MAKMFVVYYLSVQKVGGSRAQFLNISHSNSYISSKIGKTVIKSQILPTRSNVISVKLAEMLIYYSSLYTKKQFTTHVVRRAAPLVVHYIYIVFGCYFMFSQNMFRLCLFMALRT